MKKTVWIVMMLIAALALTACGADKTEAPAEPAAEVLVEEAAIVEETVEIEEVPAVEETPAEPTPLELAKTFIDGDLSALIEALGEPVEASYETSCMGDGDDGILTYDGFTVYTYLDTDGTETVLDVE